MQRLLDKAEEISGYKYDISSYADIVQAIHVVQTEMDITGTTAKEASQTISGSIGAMKSAWANLITGIGDENANLDTLINNFVDSAVTAGKNLIPRIEQVLYGIATLVEKLAPIIADKLPGIIERVLPPLLSAITTLVQAVVQALPEILPILTAALPSVIEMVVTTLAGMAPQLIDLALILITSLANGLIAALPAIMDGAMEIGAAIVENVGAAFEAAFPGLSSAMTTAWDGLKNGIQTVWSGITGFFDGVWNTIQEASTLSSMQSRIEYVFYAAQDAIQSKWPGITGFFDGIWNTLKDASTLSSMQSRIEYVFYAAQDAIQKKWESVKGFFSGIWDNIKGTFERFAPGVVAWGGNLVANFRNGFVEKISGMWDALKSFGENVRNSFKNLWENAKTWGNDLITSFTNGIKEFINRPIQAVQGLAGRIKDFLGFSEPDEGPLSNFHTYAPDMMALFAKGIRDNEGVITDAIDEAFDFGPKIARPTMPAVSREIVEPRTGEAEKILNIIFKLNDDTELGRAMYRLYNAEAQRVGVKIAGGVI